MKKMKSVLSVGFKPAFLTLIGLVVCGVALAQQNPNVLGTLDSEVTNAKSTALNLVATLCWIFLAIGIATTIYCAITESQRLKTSIITLIAAAFILTVGYAANIF